jgi:hypothetical protein
MVADEQRKCTELWLSSTTSCPTAARAAAVF